MRGRGCHSRTGSGESLAGGGDRCMLTEIGQHRRLGHNAVRPGKQPLHGDAQLGYALACACRCWNDLCTRGPCLNLPQQSGVEALRWLSTGQGVGKQVRFVEGYQKAPACSSPEQRFFFSVESFGAIEDQEHQAGVRQCLAGFGDAHTLGLASTLTQPSRVDKLDRHAAE